MSYTQTLSVAAGYRKIAQRIDGGTIDQSAPNYALAGLRSGTKVENYKSKIAAGQQAGSEYMIDSYDVRNWEDVSSTYFLISGTGGKVWEDRFTGVAWPCVEFPHNFTIPAYLEATALAKVLDKIRQSRSEMNGLIVLGEMRETLRMLRRPASSLVTLVNGRLQHLRNQKLQISRLPWAKRRDAWLKAITGSHLELVFGWMPLFSDIKDILKTVDRLSKTNVTVRARGTGRLETVYQAPLADVNVMASNLFLRAEHGTVITTEGSIRYEVGLRAVPVVDNDSVSRVLSLSGVTLENFVPALYEIMPWSFLLDYFSNLGKVIEGWTTDTSDVIWTLRTERLRSVKLDTTRAMDPLGPGNDTYKLVSYGGGYGHSQTVRTTLHRTIVPTLGVPKFHFRSPGDSPKKLFNMLALLEQQRLRSRDLKWLSHIG